MKLVYTEQSLLSLEEALEFIATDIPDQKVLEKNTKIILRITNSFLKMMGSLKGQAILRRNYDFLKGISKTPVPQKEL